LIVDIIEKKWGVDTVAAPNLPLNFKQPIKDFYYLQVPEVVKNSVVKEVKPNAACHTIVPSR